MQSRSAATILIVDADFAPLRESIIELESAGYRVATAESLGDARATIQSARPSLVIVEWSHASRAELLKEEIPTIIIAGRPSGIDAVVALESGAADYIGKPLDPPVFLARIRAVLRRATTEPTEMVTLGQLEVNLGARTVRCAGKGIDLSQSEFSVLEALVGARGRVMTRKSLIAEVIGEEAGVTSRVIDTHVFTLRRKLGACGKRVQTVRGVGYRLD